MSDPNARLREATDQFGAALADTFRRGMRQAIAKQIAEEFGPGPWILHEDGRVEQVPVRVVPPRRPRTPKTQTKKETP
jgi:hypothetical protein